MPGSLNRHARIVVAFLLGLSLAGFARPAPASAAVALDQMSLADGARLSVPAMAQTVTPGMGGLLGVGVLLSRTAADTAPFRVEIRGINLVYPLGDGRANTGTVFASATVNPSAISTNAAAPTWTWVTFAQDAIIDAAGMQFAIVLLRGTNTGLHWHASAPNVDSYAPGTAWLCAGAATCWSDHSPLGTHDFAFQTAMSTGGGVLPPGSPPPDPIANVIGPFSPTNASTLIYTVKFMAAVTGLAASDLVTRGSATGCVVGTPVGSGRSFSVPVTGCSQGTLAMTLKEDSVADATDGTVLGPSKDVSSPSSLRIDRTTPTATAPVASLRMGLKLDGSNLPVRLTWTGADTGGAGIAYYQVWRSTNAGASWTLLGQVKGTSFDVSARPMGSLQFMVRAVDAAGNRSAWRKGPALAPRLVQESSLRVAYRGTWTNRTDPRYSGGTARSSVRAGSSAAYTFTGRSAAIVMTKAPTFGKVRVYVNGWYLTTIDTRTSARADGVLVWTKTWTTSATRTIRLVVEGTIGRPRVDLDAFARL